MDERRKHGWAFGFSVWIIAAFPVLYVASVGPAYWLVSNGFFPQEYFENAPHSIYVPVFWLYKNSDAFEAFLNWYVMLWLSLPRA